MLKIGRAGHDYGRTTRWFVMLRSDPTVRLTFAECYRHPIRAARFLFSGGQPS